MKGETTGGASGDPGYRAERTPSPVDSGARSRAIRVELHDVAVARDEHAKTRGLAQVKHRRDAGHHH